jgi:hypothetical protein
MQHVTIEQLTDLLEIMTINQSIDSGFATAHTRQAGGVPTILISTRRGAGDFYVIQ